MTREGRHAGQRQDQRDAAGAGLRPGRRHRRLAADLRPGDEGAARLAPALHLGEGARPDLRRAGGQPGEPDRAQDDYIKIIKVWDKVVHYINDPKTQADAVKIMAKRVGLTPEDLPAAAQGHAPARRGGRQEDVQEGRRARLALRLDEDRRRLQRRQRGLQAGAGRQQLHRSVADRWRSSKLVRGARTGVADDAMAWFQVLRPISPRARLHARRHCPSCCRSWSGAS